MLSLTTVRVVGPSMDPAVRNGEWWVVHRGARIRTGDVVLLTHPHRPALSMVKRVIRREGTGWWVEGDNMAMSDDSRVFGPVSDSVIEGRLLFRYRPLLRMGD